MSTLLFGTPLFLPYLSSEISEDIGEEETSGQEVPDPIFCTMDVRQCRDGSYVQRDGERNCEFFPCPDESERHMKNPHQDAIDSRK